MESSQYVIEIKSDLIPWVKDDFFWVVIIVYCIFMCCCIYAMTLTQNRTLHNFVTLLFDGISLGSKIVKN